MKTRYLITLVLTVFFSDVQGIDKPTVLDCGWFGFVSATETNITLKRISQGMPIYVSGVGVENDDFGQAFGGGNRPGWGVRLQRDDREFTVPIDQEIKFSDGYHCQSFHTPVMFKNQDKGFRILSLVDNLHGEYTTNPITYVAISDNAPIEMDEDDMEMIMADGEWVTPDELPAILRRKEAQQELSLQLQQVTITQTAAKKKAKEQLQGEALADRLREIDRESLF